MTEVSEVQILIDLIIKLIKNFSGLGSTFGEIITFILNLGLSLFKIQLPSFIGSAIIVMASLIYVIYSIQKHLKLIYIVFGVIAVLMGIGGVVQYFGWI